MSGESTTASTEARIANPIASAFATHQDIRNSIQDAILKYPYLTNLFLDISEYVHELQYRLNAAGIDEDPPPVAKRRKLNGNSGREDSNGLPDRSNGVHSSAMSADWPSVPAIDVSFLVPQRKKLLLQISRKKSEGVRAINPSSKQNEFGVSWSDTEYVFCLPVPEKAQATYNFCVFPRLADGIVGPSEGAPIAEPIVWAAPELKAKDAVVKPNPKHIMIEDMKAAGIKVIEPDAVEFESQVQQAYRKGEKSYHVKAFRGSKDGYLYFLQSGILWAFKKPLQFFSFPVITSISYTSVLQRTFNLNITAQTSSDPSNAQTQDFEFSMIDQADFAGIDAYIKRHRLQDASMAEERRAKKLNINGVKGDKDAPAGEGERESELEKAAREAEGRGEDDEEEEEDDENFDPGSEGESEGSGTSDEDDDEQGDGDGEARGEEGGEDEEEEED